MEKTAAIRGYGGGFVYHLVTRSKHLTSVLPILMVSVVSPRLTVFTVPSAETVAMELSALLHAAVMSVPFTVKEQLRPTGRDMSNVPSLGLMVVPYSLSSVSLLTSTLPVLGLLLLLGLVVVLLLSGVSVPLSGASLSSLTVTVQVTDSPSPHRRS